jgi:RimJ/RimL family protein N-acetyltransferase
MVTDDGPQTDEEILEYLRGSISRVVSYGVIDKNNTLSIKHEAPIIGMITFEPATIYNGYFHVTSRRKAWGSGLMDEAGKVAIQDIFENIPSLTRVSAAVLNNNSPAKGIAKRLGFKQDGMLPDFLMSKGSVMSVAHFGLTRVSWNEMNKIVEEPEQLSLELVA